MSCAAPNMLRARFDAPPCAELVDCLRLEALAPGHYESLAQFHYRAARPRVVSGGFALTLPTRETAGVLLISPPHLCCRGRDVATGGRYRGLSRHDAAVMLNREVRCISRVIIDPRFRGLGLAVRLVRHALRNPEHKGIRFTEALAAMGRVHPLFERAGMTRFDAGPLPANVRLAEALREAAIEPRTLASLELARALIEALEAPARQRLERELRRWYASSGANRAARTVIREAPIDELLRAARARLLSEPVYYAYRHSDIKREGES